MNKSELSIGDWVKVHKLVYDNDREDFDNGIHQVRRLRDDNLDVYAVEDLSYSEVEPIMITKSVLEKIGFVEKESHLFEFKTDSLSIAYSTMLGIAYIIKAKDKIAESDASMYEDGYVILFDLSAKILYLHQLQHLLRIIGKDINGIDLTGIYEF